MELKCRSIARGRAGGEVVYSEQPLSFFGGVDPENGNVVEKGHELEGRSVARRVLVFPRGKGSTVGSYALYRMKKNNSSPAAIVNEEAEAIVAVGAIISGIPMVDNVQGGIQQLKGKKLVVDADKGEIRISKGSL